MLSGEEKPTLSHSKLCTVLAMTTTELPSCRAAEEMPSYRGAAEPTEEEFFVTKAEDPVEILRMAADPAFKLPSILPLILP